MKTVEQLRRFTHEHGFAASIVFSAGLLTGIVLFIGMVVLVDLGLRAVDMTKPIIVVAGSHAAYVNFLRESGLSTRQAVRINDEGHNVMGIEASGVMVHGSAKNLPTETLCRLVQVANSCIRHT